MSPEQLAKQSATPDTEAPADTTSLLDQAVAATKRTERPLAEQMLRTFTEQALDGTVTWNRSVGKTVAQAVAKIDETISRQLAAVMQAPEFQKLEGTWRGMRYLVSNTEHSVRLKLRVLNVSKRELFKDVDKSVEFDQSQIFKKIYEAEFGSPGGAPFSALIGDYAVSNHPEDVDLITKMSNVAAAAFCPFITGASAELFGFESFAELSKPRDLEKIFDSSEYARWNGFRDSEDARFVTLAMPRVLSRLPYGEATKPVEAFAFEEFDVDEKGRSRAADHNDYCWMNAAYVLGTRLTNAFARYGWCTAIRGAEGGGKVEGLPTHIFATDDGDIDMKCPTEIAITDRREGELSKLGFMPLSHYKNTDYAVFFGGQTAQRAKKYDSPDATANAAISARLPYIMATARFAHYLKVIARDKIGSFMEVDECQDWLNQWISQYILRDEKARQELKARFPLAEAKIEVREVPGAAGAYNAIAWLRPWLQLEELTTSMRLVARIPQIQK